MVELFQIATKGSWCLYGGNISCPRARMAQFSPLHSPGHSILGPTVRPWEAGRGEARGTNGFSGITPGAEYSWHLEPSSYRHGTHSPPHHLLSGCARGQLGLTPMLAPAGTHYGSAPTGCRSPDLAASHGSPFLLPRSEKAPFSLEAGHQPDIKEIPLF